MITSKLSARWYIYNFPEIYSAKLDTELHKIPINGVLDLHFFSPEDLSTLIDEYIHACIQVKIYQVRFIHGKGIGNMRRSVHALLERNPHVVNFQLAGESGGGWGATIANLKPDV